MGIYCQVTEILAFCLETVPSKPLHDFQQLRIWFILAFDAPFFVEGDQSFEIIKFPISEYFQIN